MSRRDPAAGDYVGVDELARLNAELVAKIIRILKELSLEPATPDEARHILQLRGAANVAF